jgi:hypothetical protein
VWHVRHAKSANVTPGPPAIAAASPQMYMYIHVYPCISMYVRVYMFGSVCMHPLEYAHGYIPLRMYIDTYVHDMHIHNMHGLEYIHRYICTYIICMHWNTYIDTYAHI